MPGQGAVSGKGQVGAASGPEPRKQWPWGDCRPGHGPWGALCWCLLPKRKQRTVPDFMLNGWRRGEEGPVTSPSPPWLLSWGHSCSTLNPDARVQSRRQGPPTRHLATRGHRGNPKAQLGLWSCTGAPGPGPEQAVPWSLVQVTKPRAPSGGSTHYAGYTWPVRATEGDRVLGVRAGEVGGKNE